MMAIKVKAETTSARITTAMAWIVLFSALFIANASAQPVTNSDRPDVTPVSETYMQNLLEKYARQKKDFGSFLAMQPGLTLATGTIYSKRINDLSKLPAPPDADLQSAVEFFADAGDPSFRPPINLLWLPMKKIGAVYFDEGSGACLTYFLFRSDGKIASLIDTPNIFEPEVCGNNGGANNVLGSDGFLVEHGHQVLALVCTFEELSPFDDTSNRFTLKWEEWSPAGWIGNPSNTVIVTSKGPSGH